MGGGIIAGGTPGGGCGLNPEGAKPGGGWELKPGGGVEYIGGGGR